MQNAGNTFRPLPAQSSDSCPMATDMASDEGCETDSPLLGTNPQQSCNDGSLRSKLSGPRCKDGLMSDAKATWQGCRDESSSAVTTPRHGYKEEVLPNGRSLLRPLDRSDKRITADDLLLRQRYGSPLPELLDAAMNKVRRWTSA